MLDTWQEALLFAGEIALIILAIISITAVLSVICVVLFEIFRNVLTRIVKCIDDMFGNNDK